MKKNRPTWWALVVLALAGAAGLATTSGTYVEAADHLDPPARTDWTADPLLDQAADINDFYAWHDEAAGTVTTIVTFGGPVVPDAAQAMVCDPEVIYEIHISNDDNLLPDDEFTIDARFGEDDLGNCFLRVTGAPGMAAGDELIVPVEFEGSMAVTGGDVRAHAGLHDDPFFFDLAGFEMTAMTGTLSFDNTNDSFARMNTSAIVIEFPLAAVAPPVGTLIRLWASTSRITP